MDFFVLLSNKNLIMLVYENLILVKLVIWYLGINNISFVYKINYIGYKCNCLLLKINIINEKFIRNKKKFIVFIWNIFKL